MKKSFKSILGVLVVSTFLFSCSTDEPTNNNPTSNYFKAGDKYFPVSNGYIFYYGDNEYDIFISDGTYDESADDIINVNRYLYFEFGSNSNSDLTSGFYTYDEAGEYDPETFAYGEFFTDDGQTGGTVKNPFDKTKKNAFVNGGYYYVATGGNVSVSNLGGSSYNVDFTIPCKEYDPNTYEETGSTEQFTGNFEGNFTFIDARTVNLQIQFIDFQTNEVVDLVDDNGYYNFDNVIMQLYTNETDYYNSTNGISYGLLDAFYVAEDGNSYPDIFEFLGLETGIYYYFDAIFESTSNNGYYGTSGILGETLEYGENLIGIYIEWYYNNGVKKMRIKSIEKLSSSKALKQN
ncbi:MAG: hypothetical protein WCX31_11195 [Salinivirgaceae bacterium]